MRGPFHNRDFRRLFAGRVVTNVGDSLYFVAAMWLVYKLTNDPFYSGLAGFLTMAPSALQFLAGPLVDRWSIRRTLTGTQAIQGVVVLIVPAAHLAGVLTAELVLVVMPLLALLNQLVYPAQTAALPRLLDEEDLVAANSAFSIAYQGIDMVANAAAGLLVALIGAVWLFAVDAVTFGVAALLFVTVVVPAANGGDEPVDPDATRDEPAEEAVATDGGERSADPGAPDGYLDRLREGASYLRGTFLLWLVGGAAMVNFTAGMMLAAMPAYADTMAVPSVLASLGDAGAYGVLMAGFAAGNLLGAVGANLVDDWRFGYLQIVGFAISGVLWISAIAADWLPLTAVGVALALLPIGVTNVQLAAVVQSAPPKNLVGRVSSVLGSATAAAIPVGSLAGGAVAGAFGPQTAMFVLGFGTLGLAAYVLAIPSLRRLPAAGEIELHPE